MTPLVIRRRSRSQIQSTSISTWQPAIALLLIAALVGFVGCAAGDASASPSDTAQQSPQREPASQPPGSAGVPIVVTPLNENRWRVEHLCGTSEIPAWPTRICALAFADEMLAIGMPPAAASSSATGFPDYLRPQLEGVVPVYQMLGTMLPDFETIVQLQPDLILTSNTDPQTYAQLSKIAPVVVLQRSSWDDQQRILDVGNLLGKEQQAQAVLAAYQAQVAAAKAILQQKIGIQPVSFFRVFGRQMYIHGHTRGGLLLYDELGLKPPALLNDSPRGYMLSPEALLQLDAEHLFVAAENNLGAQRSWESLLSHPAWQRVPAVKQKHVYPIQAQHQWLVPGIQGKSRMIDEIVAALAPESLAEVQQAATAAYEAQRP
ncbi:hypothetical protein DTL42_17060 [Bremerella cremea]|uniref:Fe/B12 periplasmic-binding domain-containing protein n=1 Tax=Bremerella cremea TaxID=1031537 RepID=A0A368KNA4_9BACT|nr:ABC transporter substrate-binding protein [Bremerella cremea]RCS44631.1 hypothetical protein DTL42_17060 [Bremerella cremea]